MSVHKPLRRAWVRGLERWALPAVLLLAFALRVYRLGEKNIWWDEGFSIALSRMSFLGATLRTAADVHPPLFYWHLWSWVRLTGESEFAMRFLSVAWGTLTVVVAYALGRRLGGRTTGLAGALLLALARFHVWWSQELRMHALATLTVLLTLYVTVRWLEEERERSRAVWPAAYVLAAAACLYSLYMAGFGPLVANLYAPIALVRIPRQRRWGVVWRWLGAQCLALALFAPWLVVAVTHMQTWSSTYPFGLRLLLELYATMLGLGISTEVEQHLVYLIPFALVLVAGLATLLRGRRTQAVGLPPLHSLYLLGAALVAMPLAVYLVTQPRGIFHTPRVEARYLLLSLPAFSILMGWCVARLARVWRPLGVAALASCVGVAAAFLPGYYGERYVRDDLRTMVRMLAAYARPSDAVLLISGSRYEEFGYYYEQLLPADGRPPVLNLPRASRFTPENVGPELESATAGRQRFWVAVVEPGIQDPDGLSLPWLDQHFQRAFTHQTGYNALILYGDPGEPLLVERGSLAPQHTLDIRQGGLELLGYDLPARECRPGDRVELGIYYASEAPLEVEVEWDQADGEMLHALTQQWAGSGEAAGRAAVQFSTWPWARGGASSFLLRWRSPSGEEETLRLPGPRILAPAGPPLAQSIAQPLDLTFSGGIRLRGYDLHRPVRDGVAEARAGDQLVLDLYWQAQAPIGEDYTVFTHLVGTAHNPATGGPVWGQHDGPPVDATYPTSQWLPGQLILDRHVLEVDAAAPAGEYELEVGLYLGATGERLAVAGSGEDRIVLGRVQLRR